MRKSLFTNWTQRNGAAAKGRPTFTMMSGKAPRVLPCCPLWLRKRAFSFVHHSRSFPQGILSYFCRIDVCNIDKPWGGYKRFSNSTEMLLTTELTMAQSHGLRNGLRKVVLLTKIRRKYVISRSLIEQLSLLQSTYTFDFGLCR